MHTWQGRQRKHRSNPSFFSVLALFLCKGEPLLKESHYEIDRRKNFWK